MNFKSINYIGIIFIFQFILMICSSLSIAAVAVIILREISLDCIKCSSGILVSSVYALRLGVFLMTQAVWVLQLSLLLGTLAVAAVLKSDL